MTRFLPLLFLAAAAAEIASIIWVGSLIGVFPTLLLMLLGGTIGVRLIKTAGMSLAEAIRSPVQKATPLKGIGGQAAARAVSGLLFLLPGFFSDALGLLLFLPLVRRWLGSQFRVDTYSTVRPTDDGRFGPVIDAEAVEIAGEVEVRGREGG
ncbi:MAG: hypothetical protein RJA94_1374 [Pseudomonadota bacterium]|jgi:UPF0716 protein FxsA